MSNIGVNGFGRIGRYFTRLALQKNEVNVAVVNDLGDIQTLAHLLKYDSVHRALEIKFEIVGNSLVFENGKKIIFTQESKPENIPWKEYDVDIVIESTGIFLTKEKASGHLLGGAKRVIISAPPESDDVNTVVLGVNDSVLEDHDLIISNASCTTNSAAPMIAVLESIATIESAYITTIHSYTTDQKLHDAPHKDLRRARAAALSIVPTSTGAAKAITKIFPDLEGKIGGCGLRVPVPNGSLTDLTIITKELLTVEEINAAFLKSSKNELAGILEFTKDPIVSVDIIGNSHSVIFDSLLTSVIGKMVKVVGWYDNEAGYCNRLLDLVQKIK
jgi:glyceraldehyde 3-phosphate dehydrogenase